MENHSTRSEILDTVINDRTIREMTSFEFCQFCLTKLHNVNPYDYEIQGITRFVNSYTLAEMDDETKVDTINRLIDLGLYD